jgi:hypothetical protein
LEFGLQSIQSVRKVRNDRTATACATAARRLNGIDWRRARNDDDGKDERDGKLNGTHGFSPETIKESREFRDSLRLLGDKSNRCANHENLDNSR